MLSVRLNDEMERKLEYLTEFERKSRSDIVKEAIAEYYASHHSDRDAFELGKDLFDRHGSGKGDLSVTYKKRIKEKSHARRAH